MAGVASNPLNVGHAFGGYSLPHRDSAALNPEFRGDLGHQPTFISEKRHAGEVHAAMLSITERGSSSDLLSTAYRVLCQPLRMSIASEIKAARTQKGWTQRELAKRIKVSNSAVAQWELDQTKPTVQNRVDLSKMFGIPFIKLLPEISVAKGVSADDQELLATVQQLLELPKPVRQGLLMTAAATAEALRNQTPPE